MELEEAWGAMKYAWKLSAMMQVLQSWQSKTQEEVVILTSCDFSQAWLIPPRWSVLNGEIWPVNTESSNGKNSERQHAKMRNVDPAGLIDLLFINGRKRGQKTWSRKSAAQGMWSEKITCQIDWAQFLIARRTSYS